MEKVGFDLSVEFSDDTTAEGLTLAFDDAAAVFINSAGEQIPASPRVSRIVGGIIGDARQFANAWGQYKEAGQ